MSQLGLKLVNLGLSWVWSIWAPMGPLGARMSQIGAQMVKLGAQMGQFGTQMGQVGHKWINLGTNGSTWAQIGKYEVQLLKFMV